MNQRSRYGPPVVRYVTVVREHAREVEVIVAAYARDNVALDGWDVAGAAYHRDVEAAESMAVRNLQRTLVETGIRAMVVPARG